MGCGGLVLGLDEENLDEMLENHEGRLCGEVPAPFTLLSDELEADRVKPGRTGIALGLGGRSEGNSALPFGVPECGDTGVGPGDGC